MFNMVVLIYIFLHSSKYSINTVNKPSHNVSLFSASLLPSDTSVFQHWTSWMARNTRKSPTWRPCCQPPETRQRNTTHQISRTLADHLSLNNGTYWNLKIIFLTEEDATRKTKRLKWGMIACVPRNIFVLVALKEFEFMATLLSSSYVRQ